MIWTEIKLARNASYFEGNQKMLDQILNCENTSDFANNFANNCNITLNNLYLLLNRDLGAHFCIFTRRTDPVLQFCIIDRTLSIH